MSYKLFRYLLMTVLMLVLVFTTEGDTQSIVCGLFVSACLIDAGADYREEQRK